MLIDKFNRKLELLEIEVSHTCQLHCNYCRHAGATQSVEQFPTEHILRFLSIMSRLGLKRVRFVGGEPLLRPDILDLCSSVKALPDISFVDMVSNGITLANMAAALKETGLDRVSVLLSTLDPAKFTHMTGGGILSETLAGIDAAKAVSFPLTIKIPILGNSNNNELEELYDFAISKGANVRFSHGYSCNPDGSPISAVTIIDRLEAMGRTFTRNDQPGTITLHDIAAGVECKISTLGMRDCMRCNRIWLTNAGILYLCNGYGDPLDLQEFFEDDPSESELVELAAKISLNKPNFGRCACAESPLAQT